MSGRRPHRSKPVSIVSRLDHRTLLARYERLLTEYDRMAGRIMVEQAEARRMSRASGRNLDRMIRAQHRAEVAESALAASQNTPVACVRLVLRCERMLYAISYDACPSCRLSGHHRYNCRLSKLLADIQTAIPA